MILNKLSFAANSVASIGVLRFQGLSATGSARLSSAQPLDSSPIVRMHSAVRVFDDCSSINRDLLLEQVLDGWRKNNSSLQ